MIYYDNMLLASVTQQYTLCILLIISRNSINDNDNDNNDVCCLCINRISITTQIDKQFEL